MSRIRSLQLAILAGAALAGLIALVAQYLTHASPLPIAGEYFLTTLAKGQIGLVSIAIALGFACAVGFYTQAPPVAVGLSMIAVFPIIVIYEATRFPGSHSLIPFELIFDCLESIPIMIAAWLGRVAARQESRQSVWSGQQAQ